VLYKIIELDGAVGIYYVVSDLDLRSPFINPVITQTFTLDLNQCVRSIYEIAPMYCMI